MLEIHTCPVWQFASGIRIPGFYPMDDHPPVVGWCNVAVIAINGESRNFLLTLAASE